MSIICGWASIDENGKASGGKAGDQTGREVKLGPWYQFGQKEVYRWKDPAKAKKYASIIRAWCNNPHIGYDQGARTTLGKWCKAHKWSYKVTENVETDCSRMVADAVNCTMGRETIKIGETFYTGNLGARLMRTGLFECYTGTAYTGTDTSLKEGDIINNPTRHVISALENGSKVKTTTANKTTTKKTTPKKTTNKKSVATIAQEVLDGEWGNGPARIAKLKAAGYNPVEVQEKVNELLKKGKTPKAQGTGKVTAKDGLNIRTRPSTTTGKVIRAVPYGTKLTCYGKTNGWWKVSATKQEWAYAKYIK